MQAPEPAVNVVGLLPSLNNRLLQLLHSLQPADWNRQTVAKRWTVKDITAHLLDGNIRILSMLRDGHFAATPDLGEHSTLVTYLDGLNADWVKAMERVSPSMLILLHESTGDLFNEYYASLDPFAKASFPVAWAGEEESFNWMHIAGEYTEKWLHQQQIRDALDDDTIMSREFFYPFINIFMLGLPHTYRNVTAPAGTCVQVTIPGHAGGLWQLVNDDTQWLLHSTHVAEPASELIIDAGIAWKLFSKSIRPAEVRNNVSIVGDQALGATALSMVSVMA